MLAQAEQHAQFIDILGGDKSLRKTLGGASDRWGWVGYVAGPDVAGIDHVSAWLASRRHSEYRRARQNRRFQVFENRQRRHGGKSENFRYGAHERRRGKGGLLDERQNADEGRARRFEPKRHRRA
ncbi:MAG TPA: hypothetical protein VK749_20090 [Xanthobacteraceae bacterium]|nr:hypothetical protein [Xanthobacteraceae bacterium]